MKVMFVDDDEVTQFLYKVMMTSFPEVEVSYALDGLQAIQHIVGSEIPYDMIFTDVNMPVMDGYELLRKHQGLDSKLWAKAIFIMLGTDITAEKKASLYDFQSVRNCLMKPLTIDVFTEIYQKKLA